MTVKTKAGNIPLGTIPAFYFSTQDLHDQSIAANAGLAGTMNEAGAEMEEVDGHR